MPEKTPNIWTSGKLHLTVSQVKRKKQCKLENILK